MISIAGALALTTTLWIGAGSAIAAPSIEATSASLVTATDATLEATIDPHGASAGVFYQFQLLLDPGEAPTELACQSSPPSGYSTCVGTVDPGALPLRWISGAAAQTVSLDLASAGVSLQPGRTYYFRALAAARIFSEDAAEWEAPATVGETGEFTTLVPPSISQEAASNVTATGATLSAAVDDHGVAATYRFQIAKSPACLPVKAPFAASCAKVEAGDLPQGSLPAADGPQPVSLDLSAAGLALEPGALYHFRLVATSAGGITEGSGASFTTNPRRLSCCGSLLMPSLEGGVVPRQLPRKTRRPVTLTLRGGLSAVNADESPPGFRSLTFELDRDGAIFTKGLPTCAHSPAPDMGWGKSCPKALVGRGRVSFYIALPGQTAFGDTAPMEIYNGVPRDGHPVLLYRVDAHTPAATTYLSSAAIEPHHGKFGTTATIRIPSIAGGHGTLTGFQERIGRTWAYRGRKVSLLSARCPKGGLSVRMDAHLTDGTVGKDELTLPCTPRG